MDKTEEILTRGVHNIITNKGELHKALSSRKQLNIYLGIDPTAPKIHLGHAVALRKLQQFAELGHHVILLIGDFTALVGDTSDKDAERPILTPEEIKVNFHTYKKQAEKLLDFTKVNIVHNSEWLQKLTYADILKLKQVFSVNDFISRELIKKRLDEGKRVRLDETEYPMMQGYDSYHLDTDIQIGGADQTFNMQAGRTLQKAFRNKESYILATEYLTGTDGRKMSKSWGNAIWLDDTPEDMYAKVMAIKDELLPEYFALATNWPVEKVDEMTHFYTSDNNPMHLKKQLAAQIVTELYDETQAEKAAGSFERLVQKDELPEDIKTLKVSISDKISVADVLVLANLTASKSDAKRLIEQGGVEVNGKKVSDPYVMFSTMATDETLIQVGKRKFIKIKQ